MPYGISDEAFARIVEVFRNSNEVQAVKLFGSRVLGSHREGSGIDLAFEGREIGMDLLLQIRVALDALALPYPFDLVSLTMLTERDLSEHIVRAGITIFERKDS